MTLKIVLYLHKCYLTVTGKIPQMDFMSQLLYFMSTDNGRVYGRFLRFDNLQRPTKILVSIIFFYFFVDEIGINSKHFIFNKFVFK